MLQYPQLLLSLPGKRPQYKMFKLLKEIYASFFPQESFGLRITDQSITILQLEGKDQHLNIRASGEAKITPGTVKNGEIIKPKALSNLIKTLLVQSKPKPITGRNCYLSIPEAQCYEHIFYFPSNLPESKLREELDQKVAETIPLPFFEIKYDYSKTLCGNIFVVFVVAVRREVIAQYYEVAKKYSDLNPVGFEPESLSLKRNIPIDLGKDEGTILIHIKSKKTRWYLLWKETVFDSNDTSIEKDLATDLKRSTEAFSKSTKRKVSQIIISGPQKEANELMEALSKDVKLPISIIKNYKLDDANLKVVSGLALSEFEIEEGRINLLKKYSPIVE